MCQIGDIIAVYGYTARGEKVGTHSFVVLDDKSGQIQGVNYDMINLVMSSFKDDQHHDKVMKYPATFPITHEDGTIKGGNIRDKSFIKANQLYYFEKSKIKFKKIGKLDTDIFDLLIEFIEELGENEVQFEFIVDNLK